jgi:hypothetical protein
MALIHRSEAFYDAASEHKTLSAQTVNETYAPQSACGLCSESNIARKLVDGGAAQHEGHAAPGSKLAAAAMLGILPNILGPDAGIGTVVSAAASKSVGPTASASGQGEHNESRRKSELHRPMFLI